MVWLLPVEAPAQGRTSVGTDAVTVGQGGVLVGTEAVLWSQGGAQGGMEAVEAVLQEAEEQPGRMLKDMYQQAQA